MNLTSIVGKVFKSRQKELLLHQQGAVALQHNVLRNILQQGQNTEYGRRHNLSTVNTYQTICSISSSKYLRRFKRRYR